MKSYYKSVNYIILFNEILLKRLRPKSSKLFKIRHPIPFTYTNHLIDIDRKHIPMMVSYLLNPSIISTNKESQRFGPNLLGALIHRPT